jgi:hypothetical protein
MMRNVIVNGSFFWSFCELKPYNIASDLHCMGLCESVLLWVESEDYIMG